MEIELGAVIAVISFIAAVIGGFGTWMFRIDRGLNKLNALVHEVDDLRVQKEKEHEHIWEKFNEHGTRIGKHGEALAAIREKIQLYHGDREP